MSNGRTKLPSSAMPKDSDSPGGPAPEKAEPTTQESRFLWSLLRNQRTRPEYDWDKVAEEMGLKNSETAKVRFGQIKRKHGITNASSPPSPRKRSVATTAKATPDGALNTPKKRKAAAAIKKEKGAAAEEAPPTRAGSAIPLLAPVPGPFVYDDDDATFAEFSIGAFEPPEGINYAPLPGNRAAAAELASQDTEADDSFNLDEYLG